MKVLLILILVILDLGFNGNAQIKLPSIFGDNMVLQQNSEVAIWGWANPGETFKMITSWNNDTILVKANNYSFWKTTIQTETAGGPHLIEFIGSRYIKLKNIMFGEVWICSGQSNMEYTANQGIDNGDQEIANANYSNIRIFNVQRKGANYPQQNCVGSWQVCTPVVWSKQVKDPVAVRFCFDNVALPMILVTKNYQWPHS